MFRFALILIFATLSAIFLALSEPLVAASGLGKIVITGFLLALFRSPLWMMGLPGGREGRT
jgi:hypothetical protein